MPPDFSLDFLILEMMGKQGRWLRELKPKIIEVWKGQQSLLGSLASKHKAAEAIRWRRGIRMKERAGQLGQEDIQARGKIPWR